MKIPKKLSFLSQGLVVNFFSAEQLEDLGAWCHATNEIQLQEVGAGGTSESQQAEAFLHEIIEMINTYAELNLKHNQITTLSVLLFYIMRVNDLEFNNI